jgi:hypothetical protein
MVGDIGQPAYVQYDIASDGQDDVPLLIETDWPGLSPAISAAVVWPNGKAYFFRGVEYLRYDIARQRFDDGYPKAIFSNWPGVPIASPATMPRRDH